MSPLPRQDLLYTLAIAALLMVALVAAHLLVIGLWRLAVMYDVCGAAESGVEGLHPVLRFPRAEMVLGGACARLRTGFENLRFDWEVACGTGRSCEALKYAPTPRRCGRTGLLLVALTFYSALTLSGAASPRWGDNTAAGRLIAVLVLAVLVVPYGLLLWWLTVCRWYLQEEVRAYPCAQVSTSLHACLGVAC